MKNFENSPPAIKHYLSIRSVSVSTFLCTYGSSLLGQKYPRHLVRIQSFSPPHQLYKREKRRRSVKSVTPEVFLLTMRQWWLE